MADSFLSGARIVASFQSEYRRKAESRPLKLLVDLIADSCRHLGLRPADVDGLAVSSFELAPDNVVTVAEHLGVTLRWAWQGAHGGASGVVAVLQAAEAITLGRASVIVCAAADSFSVASHMDMLDRFNSAMRDYLAPYGFGGANGLFALVEREHRNLYGTRREQLGKIATSQRGNAMRNGNALLRQPLSLDDYLNARVIAEPIRLFDCVLPCEGADLVVVTSLEVARDLGLPGARLLAGGQMHNSRPLEALSTTTGTAEYADAMFAAAGITRSDVDLLELYDDYPIMVAIQLEDLGFCGKGQAGSLIDSRGLGIDGDLPLNTGGGQLSCGQAGASGGMIGLFEAVQQLTGNAVGRQVANAEIGVVSGFGMVGYGRGLSSATVILARES